MPCMTYPLRSHTSAFVVFYWSNGPTLIQCGREPYKAMNIRTLGAILESGYHIQPLDEWLSMDALQVLELNKRAYAEQQVRLSEKVWDSEAKEGVNGRVGTFLYFVSFCFL